MDGRNISISGSANTQKNPECGVCIPPGSLRKITRLGTVRGLSFSHGGQNSNFLRKNLAFIKILVMDHDKKRRIAKFNERC